MFLPNKEARDFCLLSRFLPAISHFDMLPAFPLSFFWGSCGAVPQPCPVPQIQKVWGLAGEKSPCLSF